MNVGEWFAACGLAIAFFAFFADRILKPWRARLIAEADQHRAVASIQSAEMRSAFRVLAGTPADPKQGVEEVPSLGVRMAAIEKALNGGGIGTQIARLTETVNDLATNQQRLEQHVTELDDKVDRRLFIVEDAERGLRATVHELGFPTDDEPDSSRGGTA